jgi:D-threo-aldose 1-dehydrogenase
MAFTQSESESEPGTPGRFCPKGPLGLGGAPIGNLFERIADAAADETISAAWAAGLRYFDTAPLYGAGLSEHRLGRALREMPRDAYVLSTKVGRVLSPDANVPATQFGYVGGLPFRVDVDYSADGTLRSIEQSLQRLGMSRIDIVYVHDVAEDAHGSRWTQVFRDAMAGAGRALDELKRQGVIRAWGLGVNRIEPCLLALEDADPDIFLLAGRYSLLDQAALDTLFPACATRGVNVVIGGPFNSGLLAGGTTFEYAQAPAAMIEKTRRIAEHCARFDVEIRAAALQFSQAPEVVATVIAGARSPVEMRQNAALVHDSIPRALWASLKEADLLPAHAPEPA